MLLSQLGEGGVITDNLVLLTEFIMWISHRKESLKLMFPTLALLHWQFHKTLRHSQIPNTFSDNWRRFLSLMLVDSTHLNSCIFLVLNVPWVLGADLLICLTSLNHMNKSFRCCECSLENKLPAKAHKEWHQIS